MKANNKYNNLVYTIGTSKEAGDTIKKEDFNLGTNEFNSLIKKIELDGLFNDGYWPLKGGYMYMGLTFDGQNFIDNNDKKEYSKIEKTEINYNHSINVGGDNHGNIISGNDNTINSEFNKNFDNLINEIQKSNLDNKQIIIQELNNKKDNKKSFKDYLLSLLQLGVKTSISTLIGSLLKS